MFFFIPFPTQLKIKSIFVKTKRNNISCAFLILKPLITMAPLTQQSAEAVALSATRGWEKKAAMRNFKSFSGSDNFSLLIFWVGSLYQAALLGNTAIPLSQVTGRAQSPEDDGTWWGRLGPLHFAGNGSRKKTTLVMALLILLPAQGGEDWKSSGTRNQLSWFPNDLVQALIRNSTMELKTIPKIQPLPSNLVKWKHWSYGSLSVTMPVSIWRRKKHKIKVLKYNLHQQQREIRGEKMASFLLSTNLSVAWPVQIKNDDSI